MNVQIVGTSDSSLIVPEDQLIVYTNKPKQKSLATTSIIDEKDIDSLKDQYELSQSNNQNTEILKQIDQYNETQVLQNVQVQSDLNETEEEELLDKEVEIYHQLDELMDIKVVDEKYFQSMVIMVILIVIFLILKVIVQYQNCIVFITSPALKDALYVMFRDVFIAMIGLVILACVHYYQDFSFIKVDLLGTYYCVLTIFFLYTLLGISYCIYAQTQINQWTEYEDLANDQAILEKLKSQYENEYYRRQQYGDNSQFDPEMIQKIKYLVMRLEFIHPIYLPPCSESFLRKDFNFSQYLGCAYGKVLTQFFNTSWISLLLLIVFGGLYKMLNPNNEDTWRNYFTFIIPFVFLILFLLNYFDLTRIESQVVSQIESKGVLIKPEEFYFNNNYNNIDPFDLYSDIPEPEYLSVLPSDEVLQQFEQEGHFGRKNSSDDESQEIDLEQHNQQNQIIFNRIPNRQEELFIFQRYGKRIYILWLQFLYLSSIVYLANYIVYNAQNTYRETRNQKAHAVYILITFVIILLPIIMLLIQLIVLPLILTKYAIVTNIEMMKDKDLIEKVIQHQKMDRARVSFRIYQVLKLIWRELAQEVQGSFDRDKILRNFTKKQIIEAYQKCGGALTRTIRADQINSLVRQCGQYITKQESYLLLKKSISKGDKVNFKQFSRVIENNLNEVKIDPYLLVLKLFKSFFNQKQKVPFDQIETFFGEFNSYFIDQDIMMFLKELNYIKRDKEEIDLTELASLIRDDLDHFAK